MPIKCHTCGWNSTKTKHKTRDSCPVCRFRIKWSDTSFCRRCNTKTMNIKKDGLCCSCSNKVRVDRLVDGQKITAHSSVFGYTKRMHGSFESNSK